MTTRNKITAIAEKYIQNRNLIPLQINDQLRIQPTSKSDNLWKPAKVTKQVNSRYYIVTTPGECEYKRNRQMMRKSKAIPQASEDQIVEKTEKNSSCAPRSIQFSTCTREGKCGKFSRS